MKPFALILFLLAGCAAAPTTPKSQPVQLHTAMSLAGVVPAKVRMLKITWPEPPRFYPFMIYSATNLDGPWSPCAIRSGNWYWVPVDKPIEFFKYREIDPTTEYQIGMDYPGQLATLNPTNQ